MSLHVDDSGMVRIQHRAVILGDIHGKALPVEDAVHRAIKGGRANEIIQVGDFNLYRHASKLERMSKLLVSTATTLYFLPGNHEDWPYLNSVSPNDEPVEIAPNIVYLPIGTRGYIGTKSFVAVGGAYSVNQAGLTPGVDWFPDEELSPNQAYSIMEAGEADILFAHDCPVQYSVPLRPSLRTWSEEEEKHSHNHRVKVGAVATAVSPALTIHGHWHTPYHGTAKVGDRENSVVVGMGKERQQGALAVLDTLHRTVDLDVEGDDVMRLDF